LLFKVEQGNFYEILLSINALLRNHVLICGGIMLCKAVEIAYLQNL